MKDNIEKEGYRVISESEYISLATAKNELNALEKEVEKENDKAADDKNKDNDKKSNKDKTKEKKDNDKKKETGKKKDDKKKNEVKTYTLVVEENMVPSMISQKLEENKIIKDAAKFNKYMEDNNRSEERR